MHALRVALFLPLAIAFPALAQEQRSAQPVLEVRLRGDGILTSVPPGAQRVRAGSALLTASCAGDIPVRSITLTHGGLGDRRDIESVYAMYDGRRISRGRAIAGRDGRVQLRLLRFSISACRAEEVVFYADFSSDAAITGEHRFDLASAADVEASAEVSLIPVRAPGFRTVGEPLGSIAVAYLSLTNSVRYGAAQRVLRFTLEAQGDDHLLEAVSLTNQGSARDRDLQNLFLETARGERVTVVAPEMQGDRVRLVFDPPFLLRKGDRRPFTLRADVRASRRRTIDFEIEEPGDIEARVVRGRR